MRFLSPKYLIPAVLLMSVIAAGGWYAYGCHGDLFCLQRRDSWFAERLDRRTPMFLTFPGKKELRPEEEKVARWMAKQIKTFGQMHSEQKREGPISCAVVANGITLLGSGYGPLIDAHSYVFRMNNAPVVHYEQDVGTKTTFNVLVNNDISRIEDYGPDTFAVVWGGKDGLLALAAQLFDPTLAPNNTRIVMAAPKTQRVLLFSKEFNLYIDSNWFRPDETITSGETPSTGFRTIILAMHLCDTIDLFGFGPDATDRWWHYFGRGSINRWHRPYFQEEFLNTLVAHGLVHRYTGNLNPPTPVTYEETPAISAAPASQTP